MMLQKHKPWILWLILIPGVSVLQYVPEQIIFPSVPLEFIAHFDNNVITLCEQALLSFKNSEGLYTDKTGKLAFPSFQGLQNKVQDRKVYEKEKLQLPFECITAFGMNGTYIAGIDQLPEFKNLVLNCKSCQPPITCDPSYPYRAIDGICNNMGVPYRGSVQTCARRLLPASYEGVKDFRISKCGISLPNPRSISRMLFKGVPTPNLAHSNILTYFAQFLTHDITDLPASHVGDLAIDCCSNRSQQHPQCAPIWLTPDDPYVLRFNTTCFNFVRVAPCPSCCLGKRNQMIQPTSYIDASLVYGVSYQESKNLRTNDGTGRLIVQQRETEQLLPPDFEMGFKCGQAENFEYCFKAGDRRVNLHAPLMSFQTIFLREHNRLATILTQLNPNWSDETLFQEARKILIAELQIITYKEFLPLLLGPEMMTAYDLWIGPSGSRTQYDPLIDPTMLIEFSAGAFRLHNIMNGIVTNFGTDGDKRTLPDFTRDASTLYHDQMTMLLQGMCLNPAKMFSRHVASQFTEPLYRVNPKTAFDLSAIDIQRGRDAGLPSYTEVLNFLSGGTVNILTFGDLLQVFIPEDVKLLQTVYCDPRDIDFLVGMYFERLQGNMMISDSSAKIIARQFRDLKFGDRFYLEHLGNFNDDQLSTLKDVTIARFLCDNTKIRYVQHNAMKLPDSSNPIKSCSDIPELNLFLWKEDHHLKK